LPELAQFTFLRQVIETTKLRKFKPLITAVDGSDLDQSGQTQGLSHTLPKAPEPSAEGKKAEPTKNPPLLPPIADVPADKAAVILDGGLPAEHPLQNFVKDYVKVDPTADDSYGAPEHGLSVTSAYLFGPLPVPNSPFQIPYSKVIVYRILDKITDSDSSFTMYKVLARIRKILDGENGLFVNLSLGPDLPMDDDKVHAWTTTLDYMVSKKDHFLTVAAGNNGVKDISDNQVKKTSRIQVPADAVNVISVGASDSQGSDWQRASYSALGPGRKPTIIKPDLTTFGGIDGHPFVTLAPSSQVSEKIEAGTSFSAPSVLREAVGLKVLSKNSLSNLSVKALLVHYADQAGRNPLEVGWGRPLSAEQIIAGKPGEERIVFQGQIDSGHNFLAQLSVPATGWPAKVCVKGTFCFISFISVQDPATYLLTALEADFLTDTGTLTGNESTLRIEDIIALSSRPFFDLDGGGVNQGVDAGAVVKANVKSNELVIAGSELISPGFLIRQLVSPGVSGFPVQYSLVVTYGLR
jgi:hypothetical protein